MDKRHLPDFESAQERTDYIRDNADHFTITFRLNLKNHTFEFMDLDTARMNAVLAAHALQRPVMIYAVLYPYDTWVENVTATNEQLARYLPRIINNLKGLKNRRQGNASHEQSI
jgi:hypothetical protein